MSSNTSSDWGFAQPDRGAAALLFFMNDLARVVNQYLGDGRLSEEALADAQKAVDALLARYVEIQAAPEAFDGEAIGLALETQQLPDGSTAAHGAAHVAATGRPDHRGAASGEPDDALTGRVRSFRCDSPQALDFHRKLGYDRLLPTFF